MEKFENEWIFYVCPSIRLVRPQTIYLRKTNQSHCRTLVVVTPHYYLSFDRLFLFLILHCIQAHTYRYRNYLSHNNTYHKSTAKMHVLTTMTFYYLDYTMPWSTNVTMDRLLMSIIDVGKGIQLKMVRGVILPLFIDILFSFLELLSLFDLLR